MDASIKNNSDTDQAGENPVDDRGTTQEEASSILRKLRDQAFHSSDEELATALGRTAQQIEALLNGAETIDADVIMKARSIALERDIDLDE